MSAQFRFTPPRFQWNDLRGFRARTSGWRQVFAPRKPRNPLVRLALGLLGLGVLAVLLVLGVFVGAAMLAVGLVLRALPRRTRADHGPRVVEGQYRVVDKPALDSRFLAR